MRCANSNFALNFVADAAIKIEGNYSNVREDGLFNRTESDTSRMSAKKLRTYAWKGKQPARNLACDRIFAMFRARRISEIFPTATSRSASLITVLSGKKALFAKVVSKFFALTLFYGQGERALQSSRSNIDTDESKQTTRGQMYIK